MLGNLSGWFGGPYMYVFSPSSTNPKYRINGEKSLTLEQNVLLSDLFLY